MDKNYLSSKLILTGVQYAIKVGEPRNRGGVKILRNNEMKCAWRRKNGTEKRKTGT